MSIESRSKMVMEIYVKMVDIMERLDSETIEPKRANAISAAARTALVAAALQLEYQRLKHQSAIDHFIPELEREAEPRSIDSA